MRLILFRVVRIASLALAVAMASPCLPAAEGTPRTGPATEKRFPPLRLPPGFRATLFACDPLIEYPSVIARGPRPGTVFLAQDYLTGLGTEIIRRDEIRLVEDTDGDGHADRSTLYAGDFHSIQGLAQHGGTVWAMHAPLLTALEDTDGDGVADRRRDLVNGLGLPPEQNPPRLHCANGVTVGHDGWLYLALGDHGCDVRRPEGDRLVYRGGGILRCRPDGSDLHVFATGLRNIYDVALDAELNVFVRDNENDGGDYKIRVYHSFFGADHGYPYLYHERPGETLLPLADLGLGSSAGGLCYLETTLPPEYRGNLFFCEWGRAVVRYPRQRRGSSFAPMGEIEFAAGAENDPYGFKPTDLIVDADGTLLVADWADGQRPKRGRGRIYRIGPVREGDLSEAVRGPPPPDAIGRLDAMSHRERVAAQEEILARGTAGVSALLGALRNGSVGPRGRLHAVWILARTEGESRWNDLFHLAASDPEPAVRAQALRALADLADPVLVRHRLDAGRGDAAVAARLASLAREADARVLIEIIIALGRLRWPGTPAWLREHLRHPDPAPVHAAMQALRRLGDGPAVLALLDRGETPLRTAALGALADRAEPGIVDGCIERLRRETEPRRRQEYADLLTRVHRKPGPWVYWGYRPAPRPAGVVEWERTAAIEDALDRVLRDDADRSVRAATLERMLREKIPARLPTLVRWLREERDAGRVRVILEALAAHGRSGEDLSSVYAGIVRETAHAGEHRRVALRRWLGDAEASSPAALVELANSLEDGPVLAELLRRGARRWPATEEALLLEKLDSPGGEVRAAAIDVLAERGASAARRSVPRLLGDGDVRVRRSAARAAGRLEVGGAREILLELAGDGDAALARASLDSLRRLREPGAVEAATAALGRAGTLTAALDTLADLGGPEQARAVTAVAARSRSVEVLARVVRVLEAWRERLGTDSPLRSKLEGEIATVQGSSGLLLLWRVAGPLRDAAARRLMETVAGPAAGAGDAVWRTVRARGAGARARLGAAGGDGTWVACSDVAVEERVDVQFLFSGEGDCEVWLNGSAIHRRRRGAAPGVGAERFDATLVEGTNRVVVRASTEGTAWMELRFRRRSSSAEHERLTRLALTGRGNVSRGGQVFFDEEKSRCSRCHRIGDRGGRIGPELTGVARRFSRIHLVESILEPGRTVAPGFDTVVVVLRDGRSLTGVPVEETGTTLTLGDAEGRDHAIGKSEIRERHLQSVSLMPEGLEKQLTDREFLDLLAFLLAQGRETNGRDDATR